MTSDRLLVTIRVHPGAAKTRIGGVRPEPGHDRVLQVWVTQRAVDGKATEAALAALAGALGVRTRAVRLVTGARSRVKIVAVTEPPAGLAAMLAAWPAHQDG